MRYNKPLHLEDRLRAVSGSGSPDVDERVLSRLESGAKTLVVTGKSSLYDRIQSYADKVDLAQLIRRYNAGDSQALDRAVGNYVDVSHMPADLREILHQAAIGAQLASQLSDDQLDRLMRGEALDAPAPPSDLVSVGEEAVSSEP